MYYALLRAKVSVAIQVSDVQFLWCPFPFHLYVFDFEHCGVARYLNLQFNYFYINGVRVLFHRRFNDNILVRGKGCDINCVFIVGTHWFGNQLRFLSVLKKKKKKKRNSLNNVCKYLKYTTHLKFVNNTAIITNVRSTHFRLLCCAPFKFLPKGVRLITLYDRSNCLKRLSFFFPFRTSLRGSRGIIIVILNKLNYSLKQTLL